MTSLESIREHVKTPLNGINPLIVREFLPHVHCSALKNKQKREKTLEISKIYLPFEKRPKTALKEWSDKSDRRFRFKAFLTVSLNYIPLQQALGALVQLQGAHKLPWWQTHFSSHRLLQKSKLPKPKGKFTFIYLIQVTQTSKMSLIFCEFTPKAKKIAQ